MKIDMSYIRVNDEGVKNELPLWGRYVTSRGLDGGDITIQIDGCVYKGNLHEIIRYFYFNCDSKTTVITNGK